MQSPSTSQRSKDAGTLATPVSSRLTSQQLTILVGFGLVFWLVAALFIRFAPFGVLDRGVSTMLLYAITVPAGWISVQVGKRLAALAPDQLLPGMAIGSAAAMLLDGIGLVWWSIYGVADRLPGAAWLLWGVAMILIAAFVEARRQGS